MLYANTDDGSSALWVCDDDGIVVDNISYSIGERAPILEQINEHYGTSFTGWSDNEIALVVGDTIPNWNEYEKIEMSEPFLWKQGLGGTSVFVFGKVENNILTSYAASTETALVVSEQGSVLGSNHVDETFFNLNVKPKLDALGIAYTSIVYDTSTYHVNDNVENWSDYTVLT